jgi:hypothetical protein
MISSRRLRLLSGPAASIIGLLVIACTLLGLLQVEIQSITIFYLSILSLVVLGIGASAILYNRSGRSLWRTCLLASLWSVPSLAWRASASFSCPVSCWPYSRPSPHPEIFM